jgi:hypothetical protein
MSTVDTPLSLVAYIRRLSKARSALYIRIGNSDISRLGLRHGQAIEIDLGRVRIAGIVKTSGGSPWLAPAAGSSNAAITTALRNARFEHGMDVSATARSLSGGPGISILPAANDRTPTRDVPVTQRPTFGRQDAIRMTDPLVGFDWTTLYRRYDASCRRFDPRSIHLETVRAAADSDRSLYYHLVQAAGPDISGARQAVDIGWYEALLYWKLYSQPAAVHNIAEWLRKDDPRRRRNAEQLRLLLAEMPRTIPQQLTAVTSLLKSIDKHRLDGMGMAALPVRSTFLHILYPTAVPIFDKMVRQAVGLPDGNQSLEIFCEYLPHAWALARRHAEQLAGFKETPVRLTDMALWIIRNSLERR